MRSLLALVLGVGLLFTSVTLLADPPQRVLTLPRRFDYTPDEIKNNIERRLKMLDARCEQLAQIPLADATFKNTFFELEHAQTALINYVQPILLLKHVAESEEVRKAAGAMEEVVQLRLATISSRPDLYAVLKAAADKKETLDAEDDQLRRETLLDFVRAGSALPEEKRAEMLALKERMFALTNLYEEKAIKDSEGYIVMERSDLAGYDEEALNALEKEGDTKVRIPLEASIGRDILKSVHKESARKAVIEAILKVGGQENVDRLEEVLDLRRQVAALLGYPTWAHYKAEKLMLKTPENALSLISSVLAGLESKRNGEIAEMLALKKRDTGNAATRIEYWDYQYYAERIRKERFQVDQDEVKEYFPVSKVMLGIQEIFKVTMGVELKEIETQNKWHSDVQLYQMSLKGKPVAYVYLDLYPRKGKYRHYCAADLFTGHLMKNGNYQAPVSAILANFKAATANRPALMSQDDVETMFHEFGHILHMSVTLARYLTFAGTNVKRDFVEVPSQLFEQWAWAPESLALVSGHYQTSNPLSADLVQRSIAGKNVDSGVHWSRQFGLSLADLRMHMEPNTKGRTTSIMHDSIGTAMGIPMPTDAIMQANWGHMMGGYDAQYISYGASRVYSDDGTQRFKDEGMLSSVVGDDCVNQILAVGGTRDHEQMLLDFLRRPLNPGAFLKAVGA